MADDTSGDLRLVRLTKTFGDTVAVDDLSLTIPQGSFFALLGPSGCGKTTTLRMVAGLERPTAGAIHLGATDITSTKPYRRPVNTVFQSYALFPHLSVFENVAFGLRRRGIKDVDAQVGQMLELVELGGYGGRRPTQLSGGQQQRVAVARALAPRPAVVLADEPTGALDTRASGEILRYLQRAARDFDQTVVMVTHDPVAASYTDRVVFLADGRVAGELRDPTADAVLERMKDLGTRGGADAGDAVEVTG